MVHEARGAGEPGCWDAACSQDVYDITQVELLPQNSPALLADRRTVDPVCKMYSQLLADASSRTTLLVPA